MGSEEEWRAAPGYEGRYEVSSFGRIRSLDRVETFSRLGKVSERAVKGRLLSPSTNVDGYLHVSLRIRGRLSLVRLHRLVAAAFLGEGNALHREVAHLDGVRANARADNLKWVSRRENVFHKRLHDTHQAGEKHPRAVLKESDVRAIRRQQWRPAPSLAAEFGVSASTIKDIKLRRRWRHIK